MRKRPHNLSSDWGLHWLCIDHRSASRAFCTSSWSLSWRDQKTQYWWDCCDWRRLITSYCETIVL